MTKERSILFEKNEEHRDTRDLGKEIGVEQILVLIPGLECELRGKNIDLAEFAHTLYETSAVHYPQGHSVRKDKLGYVCRDCAKNAVSESYLESPPEKDKIKALRNATRNLNEKRTSLKKEIKETKRKVSAVTAKKARLEE